MSTIIRPIILIVFCFITQYLTAQEENIDSVKATKTELRIKALKNLKNTVEIEERDFLKSEVEAINQRLELGNISKDEAETLKREAAEKRALNIENRQAILDNKMALLERNQDANYDAEKNKISIKIGGDDHEDGGFSVLSFKDKSDKKPKIYDRRTYSDIVFAIGVNNAIIDGESLGDSYSVLGSGFVELGMAWNTRVFKNSNALRLKYGLSFQWNKLSPKDDNYFVQDGKSTTLESFPTDLRQSEFRVTNVVVPVFLEFGPSKKIDRDNYFRYTNYNQIKIGIGAYGGFKIGNQQKLKYKEDGDRVKQKMRRNYNTSDFVYGLSAYVGINAISLYAKYDLNTIFKDQLLDQNNVSLGIRFDID